ncbi:MAG: extracellular solute-binding protein, partial [Lachnospiraceae bacterium]
MKKRTLALLLSTVMAASVIAGCSGGDSKEEKKDKEDGGGKEEIVLSVFDAHAYGLDEYDEMKKKFEEDHPGVKVEVQHVSNDTLTVLQSRVNSGDIPDVFDIESGTNAKMYYEYAYDWTDDTDVLLS